MKLDLNIILKIINNKKSPIQIEVKPNGIKKYILERDKLINDKIYIDEKTLHKMKIKHNNKLSKVLSTELGEMYFNMTKCDKAVKDAIDKQKIEFDQLRAADRIEFENKRNADRAEHEKQQIEHNNKIDLLIKRVQELESKKSIL